MNRKIYFHSLLLLRLEFRTFISKSTNRLSSVHQILDVSEFNQPVNMLQKSLLSFFKPKNNANLNSDTGDSTKESTDKISPKKLEKERKEKSPLKKEEGKSKDENLIEKKTTKKEGKKQEKKPAKKEGKKQEKNPTKKEGKKQEKKPTKKKEIEKENESTSKTSIKNEESVTKLDDSPVLNKKRRRIIALESDSEEENQSIKKVCVESPEMEEKEDAMETGETEKVHSKVQTPSSNSPTPKSTSKQNMIEKENKKSESPINKGKLSEILKKKSNIKKKTSNKNSIKIATPVKKTEDSEEKAKETPSPKKTTQESEDGLANPDKKEPESSTESKTETEKSLLLEKENSEDLNENIWKYGNKTPYLNLAKTLQKVEETSARLKIIDILSNYFRNVIMSNKDDLLPSIYLCLNTLGPAYEGQELGIAETYLMKAIAQCTGRTLAQIKAHNAKIGDLGIVAEQSRSNQKIMFRPASLTVQSVFSHLQEISRITGNNAVQKKIDKIQALFVACRECEARFLIRSLAGKLRIGLAEQSVLQALALACTTTPPNQEHPFETKNSAKTMSADAFKKLVEEDSLILKTTYCECPNFNLIVPVLLKNGIKALPKHCKITPGIPVKPMLAQPTKGVQEVLQRFENISFTCEWKYDGERAQIHVLDNGVTKIYSRNQEDNTSKYPDIIRDIHEVFKGEVKSCILDAEAVAWDQEQKKIMPFQVLSTRKRKDADVSDIKVKVCVFLFDLLFINGESLTQKPLEERRRLLKEYMKEVEEKFSFVTSIDTNTMEEVQEFLEESVKGNCEGLMVKTLDTDATYEIAKRSRNWLKLKKDYLEGCGDTLDLVVIGGYIGKGKRTGQYGGFLLASYDSENDEYQTICKIGTGFSEEALASHSEFLKQHIIPNPKQYYRYDSSHQPDHWFDPVQVWEIKCADLSLSPVYYSAIGLVDPEKGISLRFPRFLRVRDDKIVEQATSSKQVAELYQNQDQIKNNVQETKFNEEDF